MRGRARPLTISPMNGDREPCAVCAGTPSVLVAVAHAAARELTVELLEREHRDWRVRALVDPAALRRALATEPPDLVVVDATDFSRCCRELLDGYPAGRVVVIGPEPGPAYERAARRGGAGAWVARDRVAEDLSACMCAALSCIHAACPSGFDTTRDSPGTHA